MGQDRRRHARARVEVEVTAEAEGRQWRGKTVDLSLNGVKIAPVSKSISIVSNRVKLHVSLPDHAVPLTVTGTVERVDSDGIAFSFVELAERESQRLKKFLDLAMDREWKDVLRALGKPAAPAVQEEPVSEENEAEKWRGILNRLGLDHVQVPQGGTLSAQWREFLKDMEAGERHRQARKPR